MGNTSSSNPGLGVLQHSLHQTQDQRKVRKERQQEQKSLVELFDRLSLSQRKAFLTEAVDRFPSFSNFRQGPLHLQTLSSTQRKRMFDAIRQELEKLDNESLYARLLSHITSMDNHSQVRESLVRHYHPTPPRHLRQLLVKAEEGGHAHTQTFLRLPQKRNVASLNRESVQATLRSYTTFSVGQSSLSWNKDRFLTDILPKMIHLHTLDLSKKYLSTREWQEKAYNALPHLSRLRTLSLRDNEIEPLWASPRQKTFEQEEENRSLLNHLASSLCQLPQLTHLKLSSCLLQSLAMECLAPVWQTCKNLTQLSLRANFVDGPSSFRIFAESFPHFSGLTVLDLSYCRLFDERWFLQQERRQRQTFETFFLTSLSTLPSLKILALGKCHLTLQSLHDDATYIFPSLRTLILSGNPLSLPHLLSWLTKWLTPAQSDQQKKPFRSITFYMKDCSLSEQQQVQLVATFPSCTFSFDQWSPSHEKAPTYHQRNFDQI